MERVIEISESTNKDISSFESTAWKTYDLKHYNREKDPNDWIPKWLITKAEIGNKIIGNISGYSIAGVYYLVKIVVIPEYKGKGVGKKLITDLEKRLSTLGIHKILLETGKDWDANKFYDSTGFKKLGDLPNHFYNKDFVIYGKDI